MSQNSEIWEKINDIYSKVSAKVSKEDFLRRYEEIAEHFGDTITEETALMLAAYTFGYLPRSKIVELRNAKGEVTIAGTVTYAEVRDFKKKEGKGLIAKLTIADETAETTAILWDEAAELVKVGDVFPGCEVELKGFVKKREDLTEIFVNDASNVSILDRKEAEMEGYFIESQELDGGFRLILANDRDGVRTLHFKKGLENFSRAEAEFGRYIKLKFFSDELIFAETKEDKLDETKFFTKLSDVASAADMQGINARGRVSGIGMLRKIVREDRTIRYAEIYISDREERVRVLLWGENAAIFKEVDVGKEVLILNARVKDGEIHCGAKATVIIRD
ncbi:MAG: hypothetical protein H0Z28_01435 [Archaeoglobus sp.]|nr:hypothetical protein [Archaeoglobus sp.]